MTAGLKGDQLFTDSLGAVRNQMTILINRNIFVKYDKPLVASSPLSCNLSSYTTASQKGFTDSRSIQSEIEGLTDFAEPVLQKSHQADISGNQEVTSAYFCGEVPPELNLEQFHDGLLS